MRGPKFRGYGQDLVSKLAETLVHKGWSRVQFPPPPPIKRLEKSRKPKLHKGFRDRPNFRGWACMGMDGQCLVSILVSFFSGPLQPRTNADEGGERPPPAGRFLRGGGTAFHVRHYAGSTISGWSITGSSRFTRRWTCNWLNLRWLWLTTAGLSGGRSTSAMVPPARIAASARARTSLQ